MQTFLPHRSFSASAVDLDRVRLGNQRKETYQIMCALTGVRLGNLTHKVHNGYRFVPLVDPEGNLCYDSRNEPLFERQDRWKEVHNGESEWTVERPDKIGWANHAATRMWKGHEHALLAYQTAICAEWRARGYVDRMEARTIVLYNAAGRPGERAGMPPWLGDKDFHRSHQSNLIRKDPKHYRPLYPNVPADLPYVYPSPEEN